jgi:uncharacterized Fe-S radical SAM superfamily protein PflX
MNICAALSDAIVHIDLQLSIHHRLESFQLLYQICSSGLLVLEWCEQRCGVGTGTVREGKCGCRLGVLIASTSTHFEPLPPQLPFYRCCIVVDGPGKPRCWSGF